MNVNIKKLLSVLVAFALVFSMVPVTGVPAAKADATEPHPHALTLDENGEAPCVACNGAKVKWTKFTTPLSLISSGHAHYYLDGDVTVPGGGKNAFGATGGNICFNFNGHTLTSARRICAATTGVISLIGAGGKFIYNGTDANNSTVGIQSSTSGSGKVRIIGGTYESTCDYPIYSGGGNAEIEDATFIGDFVIAKRTASTQGVVTFKGTTTVKDGTVSLTDASTGKLVIDSSWTGSATVTLPDGVLVDGVVNAARVTANGAFSGKLKLSTGESLGYVGGTLVVAADPAEGVFDPAACGGYAYCDACKGEPVLWTKFTTPLSLTSSGHAHYYLDGDVTVPGGGKNAFGATGGNICFNFNGHTLTSARRICAATTGVISLIGAGGKFIYNGTDANNSTVGIQSSTSGSGKVRIIGGTYESTCDYPIYSGGGNAEIEDATFIGNFVIAKRTASTQGVVTFKGSTTVKDGTVSLTDASTGKLVIDSSWTGSATVTLPDGVLADGVVNAARVTANGAFSGKLKLSTGESLEYVDGKLVVAADPVEGVFDPAACGGYAYCDACKGEPVLWTALTAATAANIEDGESHHYYLADNFDDAGTAKLLFYLKTNAANKLCLHLNGKTLTTGRKIVVDAGHMNLIGGENGKIVFDNRNNQTGNHHGINAGGGTVNIYGGTYTYEGTTENVVISASRGVTIRNANIESILLGNTAQAQVVLREATNVDAVTFAADRGKLSTNADWTGKATVTLPGTDLARLSHDSAATGELTVNCTGAKVEYCPVCKNFFAWTALAADTVLDDTVAHHHVYLADNLSTDVGTYLERTADSDVCFNTNGKTLTLTAGRLKNAKGATINIFGGGTIHAMAKEAVNAVWSTTNVYDCTITSDAKNAIISSTDSAVFNLYAGARVERVAMTDGVVNLYGDSRVDLLEIQASGKMAVQDGWSGKSIVYLNGIAMVDGVIPTTNATVAGAFTGTLTLEGTGEPLKGQDGALVGGYADPVEGVFNPEACGGYAYCDACKGEPVLWTDYATNTNNHLHLTASGHAHLYLSKDVTVPAGGANAFGVYETGNLCFNFNGHTLTSPRSIKAGSSGKLNLIGSAENSKFIYTGEEEGSTVGVSLSNSGAIQVIGGSYVNQSEGKDLFVIGGTNGEVVFESVDIQGNVNVDITLNLNSGNYPTLRVANKLLLKGNTSITGGISFNGTDGKVTVDAGWTGTASVADSVVYGGMVNTIHGAANGEFTGTLTTESGEALSYYKGYLVTEAYRNSEGTLVLDENGMGQCPICNKNVKWVSLAAELSKLGDAAVKDVAGEHTHYYLEDNLFDTNTVRQTNIVDCSNGGAICLHLNGKTMVTGRRLQARKENSVLNIYGEGGQVIFTNETEKKVAGIRMASGDGIVRGGTYIDAPVKDQGYWGVMEIVKGNTIVENAVINGNVNIALDKEVDNNPDLTLAGSTSVTGTIDQTATGKLIVAEGWSGEAFLIINEKDFTGVVLAANKGAALGNFSGVLATDYVQLANHNGFLGVDPTKATIGSGTSFTVYDSVEKAIAAYTSDDFDAGNYISIGSATEINFPTQASYYVDFAGYGEKATVNVTGMADIYAIDTGNNTYETSRNFTVDGVRVNRDNTVMIDGEAARYIVLEKDGVNSAHRIGMAIDGVTVNTELAGISYNTTYTWDSVVAEAMDSYGVLVSVKDMPGSSLEGDDLRTRFESFNADENHSVTGASSTVSGIFKESRSDAKNAKFGKMKIYANAYLCIDLDGDTEKEILVADETNVGTQAGNAWSLHDVLCEIDQNWAEFEAEQGAVKAFYEKWADFGMDRYAEDFTNIDNVLVSDGGENPPAVQEGGDASAPV